MSIRRISGGLGMGAAQPGLIHVVHLVGLAAAPTVMAAAVRFACHIP